MRKELYYSHFFDKTVIISFDSVSETLKASVANDIYSFNLYCLMKNYFDSAPVNEVKLTLLGVGEHIVRLKEFRIINSFTQYNGKPKDKLPKWATPCD